MKELKNIQKQIEVQFFALFLLIVQVSNIYHHQLFLQKMVLKVNIYTKISRFFLNKLKYCIRKYTLTTLNNVGLLE